MLNEAPINNDVMCIANIVLNVAPNSNDATHIGSNVRIIAMGIQQFSMVAIYPSCRKADIPEMRDTDTVTRKVCTDRINFALGKNGGYIPNSSGGRLISVGRQAGRC